MDLALPHDESLPAVDETTALIERAKSRANKTVDVLFGICPPQGNEDQIRESLLRDLYVKSLILSDDTEGGASPTTQQNMEDFWFNTWHSYADPLGDGINRPKASYLCVLARSLYTDEEMRKVPAAIAGLIHEPRYVIDRTEIDGNSGKVTSSLSYASLFDVVTEYESHYNKPSASTDAAIVTTR